MKRVQRCHLQIFYGSWIEIQVVKRSDKGKLLRKGIPVLQHLINSKPCLKVKNNYFATFENMSNTSHLVRLAILQLRKNTIFNSFVQRYINKHAFQQLNLKRYNRDRV